MIHLLYVSIFISNHTIISLMVLNIIMILVVRKRNIAAFHKQRFSYTIFIDHIAAIVSGSIRITCLMNCPKFFPCCIITI